MPIEKAEIFRVLDKTLCFPAFDNGYVYRAASRLTLHRSENEWAIVIEGFVFMHGYFLPQLDVVTFASWIYNRVRPKMFFNDERYERHVASHPNDESRFIDAAERGDWEHDDYFEQISPFAKSIVVRGREFELPPPEEYIHYGIKLENPRVVHIYELCRYLADIDRERVLATPEERRANVPPECVQILQLEDWYHPDVIGRELPSQTESFQQLADVLVTGDLSNYNPTRPPNSHWSNWPLAGGL